MKNIFFGLAVCFATALTAQNYPNNGWGNNSNNNNNNYGNYDDSDYYFPDDYYYEYPEDYYADDYYRNYYTDYRQSLKMINWNNFFRDYRLSRYQITQIIDLNNQFNSYNVWNSYYRSNPQRWYYDRYYALERILGQNIYVVFQNNYYNGYNPVSYYHNRWETFYRPNYYVRPNYANININFYKVNRQQYHQSVGTNYGWKQTRNVSNSFVEDGNRNGSYRNATSGSNGFRNENATTNTGRSNSGRNATISTENTVRGNSGRSNTGFETTPVVPRVRNSSVQEGSTAAAEVPRTRVARPQQSSGNTGFSNSETASTRSDRSSTRPAVSSSSEQRGSSSSSGTRGSRGARN